MKGQKITSTLLQNFAGYVDEVKELLVVEVWENLFLNCTKNEVLILWLLYRKGEANMTQIAEYIHVPLNTATGIVSRMEKNGMVKRARADDDKRIVLIKFSDKGWVQFQQLMEEVVSYGVKILGSLTKEETAFLEKLMKKIKEVLKEEKKKDEPKNGIRKITIE